MTIRSFLLAGFFVALWEGSAAGQISSPVNAPAPAASGQTKVAPLPSTLPKSQMHLATRPAGWDRVAPQQRLSTAQRAAIVGDKPAPKELPAITASDSTGRRVSAHTAAASQHWLLLYREEICAPCDRLMNALATSQSPTMKKGLPFVVLVAGHHATAGESVRAKYATLSDATWLTDAEKQFATTVKPRGTPTLYAMNGDRVMWSASGTESNPARVEQLVSAWLADMAAQDAAAAKHKAATSTTPGAAQ